MDVHEDIVPEMKVWQLWLAGKLPLADMDRVSLEDVEDAWHVYQAWRAAQ